MARQPLGGGSFSVLAWLAFPLVPALLGRTYHETCNLSLAQGGGPDPRDWSSSVWALLAGPLLGYGFLAGATIGLPDDPGFTGPRSWLSRRAVWVGIGPWVGFLAGSGLAWAFGFSAVDMVVFGWPFVAYGWLVVALALLRRARRAGRVRRAIERGLAGALGFLGSLFGSFWAITEAWRGYFFDPRIVPLIVAAATLALTAGCAAPITYGEVRRRELFAAMLTAWLLGMALAWRWWSRPRP